MEPMETPKKSGMMARLRNSKGFSLIEMAIVLVIIGIIIAAIVKGQDLLVNSRAKQLVSTANAWKIAAFSYMDRNGRFPGVPSTSTTGLIDSAAAVGSTATDAIATTMPQCPTNPVVIGGQNWYFYFGIATVGVGDRNVLVACPSLDCSVPLSDDDVEMVKAFDTSIDGVAGADSGLVRGFGTGITINGKGAGALGGRRTGAAAIPTQLKNLTSAGDPAVPWDKTYYGAAWAFDKPY